MAQTLVPQPGGVAPAPRVPTLPRLHKPALGRRAFWAWAAVVAAIAAAVGLAVATFVDTGESSVVTGVHTALIDNGSIRAIEGTVETAVVVPHTGLMDTGSIRAVEGTVEDMVAFDAHRGLMENGTIRAVEGTVETAPAPTAG